jgi:hypothetical protein
MSYRKTISACAAFTTVFTLVMLLANNGGNNGLTLVTGAEACRVTAGQDSCPGYTFDLEQVPTGCSAPCVHVANVTNTGNSGNLKMATTTCFYTDNNGNRLTCGTVTYATAACGNPKPPYND